ncbi:MAG: hypothetical protein VX550_11530 [Bacteroidota bacterium]|nr:hypothetical protein [Bacteroidota bacterium]
MKRIFLIFGLLVSGLISAQEISNNAIGIRAGDGDGFGTEISYQRYLGGNNRLEIDLGIESGNNFDGFKASGIYHWVWNIDGGFNWYAGPGAGIAFIDLDDDFPGRDRFDDSETSLFVGGQVGIEYNFDIPLILSLDVRPEFYFGDFRDGNDFDVALGIRYQF